VASCFDYFRDKLSPTAREKDKKKTKERRDGVPLWFIHWDNLLCVW
jgi:hypothetical protein